MARLGRPRGDIREALVQALAAGPATSRELAQRACVGFTKAMETLNNMVTAGEVKKLDPVRRPGVKRPVPVYDLAPRLSTEQSIKPALQVEAAMRQWFHASP
jgi:hypothetical protein